MLRSFGHENVSVLNGGFKKWVAEGRPVESTPEGGEDEDYAYTLQND